MNKSGLLLPALGVLALSSCGHEIKKPNVIFIMMDDLGYGETGCYGQKVIKTPNIDNLASQGMRFTDFYCGAPVSGPSRCILLTGKHSGHASVRGNCGYNPDKTIRRMGLNKDSDVCIAQMLKANGYKTGLVGKFHCEVPGYPETYSDKWGFDYTLENRWAEKGNLSAEAASFRITPGLNENYYDSLFLNGKKIEIPENRNKANKYFTDRLYLHHAMHFISESKNDPFFLYLAFKVPHSPVVMNEPLKYSHEVKDSLENMYATRIAITDSCIGRLMDYLDSLGLTENTIVIFSSDNGNHNEGGHSYTYFNSDAPFRGYKRDVYEGGIRIPFIVKWPGNVTPGSVSNHTGAFWDVMPTLAEMTGSNCPEYTDGISIVPVLTGKDQKKHDYLYWEFFEGNAFKLAARKGEWKAVIPRAGAPMEIYNIVNDPHEDANVSDRHPDLIIEFERIMKEAHSDNPYYPYGGVPDVKWEWVY